MRLILLSIVVCFLALQNTSGQAYSSCGSVIEPISLPGNIPTDGTNFYACTSGAVDIAYRQKTGPVGNQPDNLYVIEFSNLRPLETNITGTWDTAYKGLVPGDTVFIRAVTFNIDSLNGILEEARFLCPSLDLIYNFMPCVGINGVLNGENDGEPGVQTLEEVITVAEILTNRRVRNFAYTAEVLENFNNFIYDLGAQVCFTYTDPPFMVFIEEDGPLCLQGDLDNDLIPNILEDVNNDGNVKNDDTDGDDIPNYLDDDDNNDGTLTADYDIDGNGDPTDDDVNNDGIPDYLFTTMVSVNEVFEILQIYPNPNKGKFHINTTNNLNNVFLYNLKGQKVQFSLNGNQVTISKPLVGVYFLQINHQMFKVFVQ